MRSLQTLAVRALQPLHRVYRRARPALRAQVAAYDAGMRFRESAESWTDDARRAWMLQRLRAVVRTAAKDVPYYRELFRSTGFDPAADFSFDDYARLPVLERGDIQRAGRALCSEAVDPSTLRRDATGGSSGTPTELWKGPEERGWGESALDYTVRRVGVQPGSRTALLWGHHLDPTARGSVRERLQDALQNMRWFESLRLSPEVLRGYHRELEAWRPTLLLAYSSALAALAEELDRAGVRPGYPECCFVTGAEKVYAHQRELITRVFGKPLHERYGGRDVGVIGIQLDPARSLSFWVDWSNVLVEPETAPHGDAPASVLITKLHADGMPMLRYRVGDEARFPEGSRPGHPALSLDEVVGREADRISLPSGGWVHGLEFPHMLKDFPVRDYRVHQRADASVTVSVVALDDFSASHRARLLDLLRANMPGLPVSVELVDAIPRTRANKWRPVVSDVTDSTATAVTGERAPAGVTGVDS